MAIDVKCKLCGKKGVQLAHWRTAHKEWLRRKMNSPAARAKAARTRARHAAEEAAGKASPSHGKAPRTRRSRKTGSRPSGASEGAVGVPDAPAGFVVETVTYRRL